MRLRLKTAIWASRKTQRRLAVDLNMSENRMSEIVCGWVTPTPEEQKRIADALNESEDVLFGDAIHARA
jgi:transcriptional regulator with XRE-family HTH domain